MRRPQLVDAVTSVLLVSWLGAAAAESIGSLHCNDARGESVAVGRVVTIAGVVTAQFSTAKNARLFVQDGTGGVSAFGPPPECVALGDSVRVTGEVASLGGQTQVTSGTRSPLRIEALGRGSRPVVALALAPTDVRGTRQPDGCEPNESRLVLVHDVLVRTAGGGVPAAGARFTIDTDYRLAHAAADSASDWVPMRVWSTSPCDASRTLVGQPVPTTPVQVTGVVSQYSSRTPTQGGYLILPRTRDDVQPGIGDWREPVLNR